MGSIPASPTISLRIHHLLKAKPRLVFSIEKRTNNNEIQGSFTSFRMTEDVIFSGHSALDSALGFHEDVFGGYLAVVSGTAMTHCMGYSSQSNQAEG